MKNLFILVVLFYSLPAFAGNLTWYDSPYVGRIDTDIKNCQGDCAFKHQDKETIIGLSIGALYNIKNIFEIGPEISIVDSISKNLAIQKRFNHFNIKLSYGIADQSFKIEYPTVSDEIKSESTFYELQFGYGPAFLKYGQTKDNYKTSLTEIIDNELGNTFNASFDAKREYLLIGYSIQF